MNQNAREHIETWPMTAGVLQNAGRIATILLIIGTVLALVENQATTSFSVDQFTTTLHGKFLGLGVVVILILPFARALALARDGRNAQIAKLLLASTGMAVCAFIVGFLFSS